MKIIFSAIFLFLGRSAFAHTPADTLDIKEVKVIAKKIKSNDLNTIPIQDDILKAYQLKSLSSLLEDNTPITIKSWGAGGLAIPAFRGTSPNHTRVFWN